MKKPGPAKDVLSAQDQRRVKAVLKRIRGADARAREARRLYATLARELGVAAVANHEGVDRRVVWERVKSWLNH